MNDRTCPFCGGVQSESRCEICNRPTVKIGSQSSSTQPFHYDHPYEKKKEAFASKVENPYLKQIHEKRLQHKQNEYRKVKQQQQSQAMRVANIVSLLVFFFVLAFIFFLAF